MNASNLKIKNIDEVHISCPTEGLAGFISEDDKVGFLDENGDIIISPVYDITNPHQWLYQNSRRERPQ